MTPFVKSFIFYLAFLLTSLAIFSCSDLGDKALAIENEGCTDPLACNYDESATLDDYSCAFEEDICGICGGDGVVADDCCDEGEFTDGCGVCSGDNSSCVNFTDEILPIFENNCTGCHGGTGGLHLDSYENVMSGGSNEGVVISGNSSESLLWQKVNSGEMPPTGNLSLNEIDLISQWINEGAQNN